IMNCRMAVPVPCQLNIICIMQYNMMPVTDYLTDFGVLREKTTQNLRYFINSFGYSTIFM
ncbi:hypothetical protein, partial [Prevotella communis]|uniref:hypothetical protein n=1 Tax=Prevotella communis TaxID=2913614 RepID=UPI001C40AAC1